MSRDKMAALQNALKTKPEPITDPARRSAVSSTVSYYVAPSREGKTNITAYLSQDYKRNLRLIQAKAGHSLQTLIAEALNDLFAKYDVPTIDHE